MCHYMLKSVGIKRWNYGMKGRDYMIGGIAVLVGAGATVWAMASASPAIGITDRAAIETLAARGRRTAVRRRNEK